MAVVIEAVLTGRVAPLGSAGKPSAIAKTPVEGQVRIGPEGLEGDMQADRRHHGGREKALHIYPLDHAPAWRAELPLAPDLLEAPGAFGENLSIRSLTEAEVCVGDLWRVGTALLQVSQARQPCWKLNARFGVPDMALRVQASGRTGWYCRVIETGVVAAGDVHNLVDRPHSGWTLARLLQVFYVDRFDTAALTEIASLETLSASWRALAARRLERNIVEDWAPRLDGAG
ncbi:molybdenum cofactor sulfurase [Methylobacterium sp. Leaf104]|uniref:MOSC domain-containing protein n=1 Tax=Methylobacterium TaxID=407 RepID=UPI0006FFF3AF|nr:MULTISPECIES: MOSC domain-containing protein [Methylobacterium]KQP41127.1 molybdenum cofactor sulfurase [Methylobacterium sp. Leaf104]MCI9882496.1 MOSC domain-containing protein [Methylobacterium goesingense]